MFLRRLFSFPVVQSVLLAFLAFSILWKGGKTLESTWLLVFVAAWAVACEWWNRKEEKNAGPALVLWKILLVFFAWTVVSYFLSSARNYGLDEVLRDGSLFLLFGFLVRRFQRSDGDAFAQRFASVFSLCIIVACLVGVAVYLLQPVSRFVGTFFDWRFATDYWPNAWAELLLLAWPVVTWWARGKAMALRVLIVGLVLGSLFLSYSRGAFLCFTGQLFLYAIIAAWRGMVLPAAERMARARRLFVHSALIGVVALGVFFAAGTARSFLYPVESVVAKATFTAGEGTSSVSERKDFWKQAFALSLERPVFGWGPYSFRFVQPRLQTSILATSDHPHNVVLKYAMERGWPAAILWIVVMLLILIPAGFSIMRTRMDDAMDVMPGFCIPAFIAVLGVIAHLMIDFNIQFVAIALPLWVLLAALASVQTPSAFMRNKRAGAERTLAILLLLVAVIEGYYLILSSLGRHAEAVGDAPSALAWYERAQGEWFSRDMDLSRAHLLLAQKNVSQAMHVLDRYASLNPDDARLWLLRGEAFQELSDPAAAKNAYAVALRFGRYNYLAASSGLSQMLLADPSQKTTEQASLDHTFQLYSDAILQNVHFIALSENVEEFAAFSDDLETLYPADAARYREQTTRVLAKAESEREKLGGQRSGLLW